MRNADRLVRKLAKLGVTIKNADVFGSSFQIRHYKYQEYLNKRAGEAAPTWELLCDPFRSVVLGRTVVLQNGVTPTFTMPDGTQHTATIYSHYPLAHILKTPIKEWDIGIDEMDRLWVGTTMLPSTW